MARADAEDKHLLALMLGRQFIVKHLRGPSFPDEETLDRVADDEEVLRGAPEARTSAFYLTGYSDFGIEVRKLPP